MSKPTKKSNSANQLLAEMKLKQRIIEIHKIAHIGVVVVCNNIFGMDVFSLSRNELFDGVGFMNFNSNLK